jgi:hypothetical protein
MDRRQARPSAHRRADGEVWKKIQAICNGKSAPITMQRLVRPGEKPPAQEQWRTMEKTMDNNGKNNAKNNGYNEKPRACAHARR